MGEDGKQEDVPAQERQLEMLVNVDRCLSKLPMVEGSSGESVLLAIYLFLYFFSLSWLTVLGAGEKFLPNERLSACWLCWITGYFYLLEALLEKVTAPVVGPQVDWFSGGVGSVQQSKRPLTDNELLAMERMAK